MHKYKKNRPENVWTKYSEKYKPILLRPFEKGSAKNRTETPKFATIDIETQDWVNYVCGEVYWKDKLNNEHSFETPDIHALMMKCFEIAKNYEVTNFVAHYGGKFDFLFFLRDLLLCHYVEVRDIIPRGSSILCFDALLHPSSKHSIALDKPLKITFRDSAALLPFSLGSLTKSFNVETLKGEMDFLFIEKIYNEKNYVPDILKDKRCVLFFRNKQIFKLSKDSNRRIRELRYWNLERNPLFPYRGRTKRLAPYIINNDWFEEVTYPIFNKHDLLTYLHHDCKSLHQCIDAFFNAPLINQAVKKWTTASQAVEVFRLFLKIPLYSLPDDDNFYFEGNVDAFVRQSYFGGRTEIFKPIFDSELGHGESLSYYDVNSLYPFTMANNKFGNRFIGWLEGEEDYKKYEMSIWHCKVRVPETMYIPPLPIKKDERLIFPTGIFKGYWCKPELEYAKSLGCEILEYYEGVAFTSAGYLFKEFIDTVYDMRLKAKEKKDNVTQMTMKLVMNSCYGRMGINKLRSKIVLDDGSKANIRIISEIDSNKGLIRFAETEERSRNMFSNPAIASFVTAYARIHLHKQLIEAGEKNVYYCDTDSVFTRSEMKTGKELGAMKLEYKCKSACFVLPKTYVNEDIIEEDGTEKPIKLTMKGFDYKHIKNAFTFTDFVEYLTGDLGNISVTEKPKFCTFKSALKMGKFVTLKNEPTIKKEVDQWREDEHLKRTGKRKKYVKEEYKISVKMLQGYYNKRKIAKGGFDTYPIKMME